MNVRNYYVVQALAAGCPESTCIESRSDYENLYDFLTANNIDITDEKIESISELQDYLNSLGYNLKIKQM